MSSPMLDATFVGVCLWTGNIFACGSIIKFLAREMCHVPETVPLRSRLCIELVFIIVCQALRQNLDFVHEYLTAESWDSGDIQW